MSDYQLTEKALFPADDVHATANAVFALGIVMEFLTPLIKMANDGSIGGDLWDIAGSLQASAEMHFARRVA